MQAMTSSNLLWRQYDPIPTRGNGEFLLRKQIRPKCADLIFVAEASHPLTKP